MNPVHTQQPPPVLQIVVERLKAASLPTYDALEAQMAQVCAGLQCPNPYLALESVELPKEVWWFNEYRSAADAERVAQAYARNTELMDALAALARRKQGLTDDPIDRLTSYRKSLSDGAPWLVGAAPFAVIAERRKSVAAATGGAVFEAPDGRHFTIASAATVAQANAKAAVLGADARVFAVRPEWSLPAESWVTANRQLWRNR